MRGFTWSQHTAEMHTKTRDHRGKVPMWPEGRRRGSVWGLRDETDPQEV